MVTIPVDDVKRGDILLVTQRPGSPLAELIIDLDGSPQNFSHSGVAGGNGTIISSYPNLDELLPPDIGGLHHDDFSHFWDLGQEVHRLVLPPDVDRDMALTRLDRYPESRETSFATAKIVMVASALHALKYQEEKGLTREGVAEIVDAAVAAGDAWESDDDFFCAEFAAYIYGIRFSVADLEERGRRNAIGHLVTKAVIRVGLELLVLGRTEEQEETLEALVGSVWKHDPAFFEENLQVVFEEFVPPSVRRRKTRSAAETALPYALVTPAMLASWGEGTQRIEKPE